MACVSLASFAVGVAFLIAGAWPILGFFGLDVALIWLAFRLNYRNGRWVERLRLSESRLEVERVGPRGQIGRWSFHPYWLKVDLVAPHEHHSRLTLSSRATSLSIGGFLTPGERRELSRTLREALDRLREGGRGNAQTCVEDS